jgi:hypothetical protein
MRVQSGRLISLGHGRWARSDEIVAIEPIKEGRGPGRRTFVWVRGVPEPLLASRSEAALVRDLLAPREDLANTRQMKSVLDRMALALEHVPPVLRRVVRDETGADPDQLAAEARQVLQGADGRN